MDNNQIKQQTILEYDIPRAINLGDVFYTIEETGNQFYYEPCKVCGGTESLTVNGVTFRCPCCTDYRSPFSICRYKVVRWRVYKISQSISNGYWQAGKNKHLTIRLYTTTGRGYGNNRIKELTEYAFKNNRNLEPEQMLEEIKTPYGREDDCVYDCYSLACRVADALNAFEEEKVKQHNKEFGTAYEIPDKPKYDPKSN